MRNSGTILKLNHSGIEILFTKLHQGCVENDEFIGLFTSRMNHELEYGKRLETLPDVHSPMKGGFDKDDGASLKNAFKGLALEMGAEGESHEQIAFNIQRMVLDPFSKWSEEHKQRIDYSEKILKNTLKVYNNKLKTVEKVQKKYFNKCRTLESLKANLTEEEISKELNSLDINDSNDQKTNLDTAEESTNDEYEPVVILGGIEYGKIGLKELFRSILTEVPQHSFKVAILGVYENVSTGSSIVSYLQQTLGITNIDKCEKFGKDLITNGFLRHVNGVGSNFVNSGNFQYQWKNTAFQIAELPLHSNKNSRNGDGSSTNTSTLDDDDDLSSNNVNVSNYFDELKNAISYEEPSLKKVDKDVKILDSTYKKEVLKLDKIRCELEELIVDHLSFMEKCELDRLRALKKVLLDFSASISNKLSNIKATIDKILIYEETINPNGDLMFLLQNYRTGSFVPNVILYDNYYDSFKDQIFGVDLETRCKNDNKTVPLIISSILSYMDNIYPDLPNDDVRTKTWLVPVRLQSTHALRNEIEQIGSNNLTREFFAKYQPEVIVSVLKLYLLELPDSIVPNSLYDLIRSIYNQYGSDLETKERINGLTTILKNLDRSNISTLNAICTHFSRLIKILKENKNGDESNNLASNFQNGISQEFSSCILRPRYQTNLSLSDKHSFRFILDLLIHKQEIFKNLKPTAGSIRKNKSITGHVDGNSIKQNELQRQNSKLQTKLQKAVRSGSTRKSSNNHIKSNPTLETTNEDEGENKPTKVEKPLPSPSKSKSKPNSTKSSTKNSPIEPSNPENPIVIE
ncbi:putative Rho-GTPase-activating protein 9 [Wickerhamomyces ciferrii]|uniref:Rho-GTPase-activating protein 9 n=1 Tax=Wickerhamomyces ciferrii (strain ATCC 14091 / BCRC 22168 / CBS 111 / JCM 3599 / NBRC 0793 / NRRL Y-1031 F-60-10) TaxID=1206466 RepID=K0KL37_WICCF|nr:putative Rho-GTPase-activating protein 9 [Wickerhamomyces ciferrii]CCH41808.1 putative Rho-GTPase-activating protein 9 [Wickerhamomyces ciferrii]